ncbi:3-isopropylmalate dehydratase, partial [Pseudomonas aeruginosa]
MKKLIGLAMLMALVGCSTSQTSAENAERVPASRVSYSGSGDSSVQITRDSGALGSGCYLGIFWDGQLAARIG